LYQHGRLPHEEIAEADQASRAWRRASACNPSGNCVEINRSAPDRVGVRDSKQPVTGELRFTADSWSAFLIEVT
jgi:hypothetical protein